MRLFRLNALLSVFAAALVGCSSGVEPPKFSENLVPVAGTVTFQGEPLAGATIQFIPQANAATGELAEAVTDASGKYELQTPMAQVTVEERMGAVPAEYVVVVRRMLMPDGSPIPAGMMEADAEADGAKESLPPKYSNFEHTTLRGTVKAEPTVIDFDLN